MGYEPAQFQIQGVTFKMKPTSPKNLDKLRNIDDRIDVDALSEGEEYVEILKTIAEVTDGNINQIDPSEINIKKVEYYIKDFLPGLSMT